MRLLEKADRSVSIERFAQSRIDRNLLPARQPFRERGESVRERTQGELWRDLRAGGDNKAAAEFHGPSGAGHDPAAAAADGHAARHGLQARPAGARRGVRDLALILVNHALQFGESMAANGRCPAALAVWTPYVLFGALGL
jgi:lipopolysaccharide export system permease protein